MKKNVELAIISNFPLEGQLVKRSVRGQEVVQIASLVVFNKDIFSLNYIYAFYFRLNCIYLVRYNSRSITFCCVQRQNKDVIIKEAQGPKFIILFYLQT